MEQSRRKWPHLAIQSVVCGAILLLILLFRQIGGVSWDTLREVLCTWLYG